MKILEIGMTKNVGGIQTFLINFNRSIKDSDTKIDYLCIYDDEKELYFCDEIKSLGARIIKVPNYQKHFLKAYRDIKKLILSEKYDVVHYNMNSACYLVPLVAANNAGVKLIISHAHNASSDKGVLKSLIHAINRNFIPYYSNLFFACSDKAGKWFFSNNILKSEDYYFIPNAINMDDYTFNPLIRKNKREELGLADELVFGNVGRFSKQKNHDYLLRAFIEIKKLHENSKLLLIGHGPLKEEIEEKVKEYGVEEDVIILSFRKDISELLQVMDCFIMPSLYEGLPVVGIEAQAAGLPCFFSTNITEQVIISKKSSFFSINESPDKHVNDFINACSLERQDKCIIDSSNAIFDVSESSHFIVNLLKNRVYTET